MTKQLFEELRPARKQVEKTRMQFQTIRGFETANTSMVKGLVVSDISGKHRIQLPDVYTLDDIPANNDDIPTPDELARWPHLRNIDIPQLTDCHVGLLIGQNAPEAIKPYEIVDGGDIDGPFALRTRLGWIVQGLVGRHVGNRSAATRALRLDKFMHDLYNKEFADLDSLQIGESHEDREWRKIVHDGCVRTGSGKYEVPLPLRPAQETPPTSEMAMKRLQGLKVRLLRDTNYRAKYTTFMEDLLSKGYMEKEGNTICTDGWYIPHFGVWSAKKNKIRVVLDCAAKVK